MLSDCNGIKPEVNNRKKSGKSQNIWGLSITLPYNAQIKRSLKISLNTFWTKSTPYQNMGDVVKVVLTGQCTALN